MIGQLVSIIVHLILWAPAIALLLYLAAGAIDAIAAPIEDLVYKRHVRAGVRARNSVRAPMPQPEPVNVLASWVPVSHDDVLFFLSPSLRGEFQDSPNFQDREAVQPVAPMREPDNTLNSSEPAGSLYFTVDGALRPRPVSGYVE